MNDLKNYSALSTKIRGMQKNFIKEDQFRSLLDSRNNTEAIGKIRNMKGYSDALASLESGEYHRVTAEYDLDNATYFDFGKLYCFCNQKQRAFLKIYASRYETRMIKRVVQALLSGSHADPGLMESKDFFDHYSRINLAALYGASNMDQVTDALRGTPYHELISSLARDPGAEIFDYESALDQYCLSSLWKKEGGFRSKKNVALMEKAFGTGFDLLNLMWISRSHRHYNMDSATIYETLIPIFYRLKPDEIKALLDARDDDRYRQILKETYYGKRHGDLLAPEKLGFLYQDIMQKTLNALARNNPYSIVVVYRYLYMKEREVRQLTSLLECVHYHISADKAMEIISSV